MAFFVKITPRNAVPWIFLGVKEGLRMLAARLRGAPSREEDVVQFVEEHTRAGDPDSVISAMDEYARSKRFLMNVGKVKGAILEQALEQSASTRVLELGGYCGYSAIRTARVLRGADSKIVSIEKSEKFAEVAQLMVNFAGLSDRVQIIVGDAGDVIPHLEGPFDLVFIDHWKERYLPDLLLIEKHDLLHEGSVVVADNVGIFEHSVRNYLEHVRRSDHYETHNYKSHMEYEDHIEDGVEISVWHGAPSH